MAKSWRNGWCEEQPHPIDVRSGVNENSSAVPFLDQRITLFNLWRWYQNVFQSSCLLLTLMGSTSSPILAICSHPGGCKWWFTAVSVGISLMIGDTPLGSVVRNLSANAGDRGLIPGLEDPQEKGMATHSNIRAREILWTEVPGGLQSMGWQRVGHD